MQFCGTELAKRVERAECGLLVDCAEAVAHRVAAFTRPIAGGLAVFAGPDSPISKVAGLGFDGLPEPSEFEAIEREFAARGAAVQVEISVLATAGIGEWFTSRGYALVGFENVLGRRLDPRESWIAREGIDVSRATDAELEAWLDVVVSGFSAPDVQGVASHEQFPRGALERVMRDMSRARGFVRYVARRQDAVAGGASMHIADGIAQLCGAATLPQHRRRGIQGALLQRRLADAAREGCDLAVITTLPGSKSQENAQKQGFDLLYTRAILRRAAP